MKKDIQIPEVKDVFIAVVQEEHLEYKTRDWNAYIINNGDVDLDTVLIVSQGTSETKMVTDGWERSRLISDSTKNLNNFVKQTN